MFRTATLLLELLSASQTVPRKHPEPAWREVSEVPQPTGRGVTRLGSVCKSDASNPFKYIKSLI